MGDHIILKTDTDVTLMANGIQKGTKDLIKDVADLKKGLDKLNGKEVTLTVKGKVDMSEVEAAKKEAAKPIETPVKLKLDASEIKALQNLPTAKAKVEFLVNKGTISKSIGKDLQAAIGKAYSNVSRKFKDFPGLDKEPNISLDNFMKRVPELSARQRSGIIQTLTDKGIISDKNIPESYETVYRLKSYLENAKKAVSKTIPSEAFTAPDLSLSATEYGNAINEQVKLVQNVLNASKFFADLSSKMNVKAAAKVSPEEMYKLMGVGSEKADTGNYVAYLADQIAKKANVYDIIDQVVTGALDPTQISQKDIANSISKITKKKESTPKASSTGKTKKKVKPVIDDSDDSDRPEGNIEKLYDELKDAYKNFVEARKARKTNSIHPSDYALKSAVFREAYAKVAPHLFDDEKEKFVGPKPMSQEVAQLAADSTRKTVEQIYSIKKPLKDLGYLGNNPDVSKIFDRISNRIIKINADKLNNRDNENGDTDEIIKNIGVMNKLASQLEDMIHADGHVDFAIKNLPTITKPATTASSLLDNSDIKKQTEETADAITRTADQVIDAKSKEADAVVAANDKIAESEKKVTNQVTDAAKEQNDTIKTVFGLKNVNSNLTETPVTPPELDGLKQLSQREFGDAQKYIKVYEDTNRTIYTLTQTYKKQFDANGNLLAEGYENAIAYYDSYEKLEGEAVKLSKKINSNYAKLDTEKYKSTDKQNPNLLKKLQDDIKSDQQDLSELHRIARLHSSLPDNDYVYQNFTQALRKGSAESSRALASTRKTNRDNFDFQKETINTDLSKQISDVESLGQAGLIAAAKLRSIQQALSGITTPTGLENVKKQINDIGKQFDTNKIRENALNYVHNLGQKLNGKQNVVIGQKSVSDDFVDSIKNGEWTGPLAGLNSKFESKYQNTSADLKRYVADAQMLGDVGKEAAASFSTLQKNLENCYTESGLEQIQNGMKTTQKQLAASKKQADEQAAAIKNSDVAKQYDNAIDKAKEVKSLNAELLGYKKKQSQYSEGSDTYTEIGNRITETAEAAKKANAAFEKLTQNDFVSKNSEALKNAGKNVEDYDKVVREMKQAQADVSGFDEKVIQANNKEAFTEQYTKAIEKVKELKSAMQDLYSFEAKGAKGQISSDDFISGFTDRFKNIKKLKENVDEFKKNTYQNNKDDADSVLNQLLFGNYEKAFTDSEQSMSDYENKITTLMTQAYSRQRKLSNDLYKMAGNKNYSEQEYTEKMNQRNGVQATYEALKAQIKNSGKNIDSDSLISDIKNASDLDRNNILGNLKESLSSQINDFENSLKHMQNTMNLPDGIASLKEKLESAFTFENGADNLGNFKNRMQDFYQTFDSLKGSSFIQFANEFGTAFDSLTKAENSSGKVSAYTDKLNGFVESYNDIVTRFHNKEIDTSKAQDEISELASKMQDFQKVAKNYDKTNSKGTYLEGTKGLVQDTKDVETMLTEYANSIGLTSKISSSINETTGQVKMQFADISGNVVTLTGNLEKAGNAMRIISSTASKASTGMSSFGTSIKGMVSGNFKGAIADIASYVSYFQVTMKAIQQAKQGFNDFLNFQKDLTNVSYTMNLSPDQLQNLGTSAIDMAKDLSMSLDNTMDIYKIYANMNTTASEIQQTAKPTAILSNLSSVDASTAADQVQGILQQFHMLEDGSTTAADASMHIVDVLDKVSGSVGIDYAKGIKIISDAVQASGQVAYDAGMSYEQLAAITAKVSERTREDGSSIGNALKTIITRTTKVGKMPQYADEVDNATLSNASASLHAIGVDVYNPDGSDRGIITVMSELKDKWDDLTDAQQAKIAFDVAATRQTSKFKSMLDAFTDSMSLAEEATTANGNAEANQEKYMESTAGKLQAIKTQMQDFWVNFYNSGTVNGVLEFVHSLTEGFTSLEKTLGPIPALLTAVFAAMTVKNATMAGLKFLSGGGLATVVG
jgi:TP901 family phage tail tape measure protein